MCLSIEWLTANIAIILHDLCRLLEITHIGSSQGAICFLTEQAWTP